MDRHVSRGALAALLSITITGPVVAQTITVLPRIARDSVGQHAFGVGLMDSAAVLARALAHEQYGSPVWVELSRKLDSLLVFEGPMRVILRRPDGFASTNVPRGWLGFNAQGPSVRDGENVRYLAYPQILSVDPSSPADRAGIASGDVLVAFNGMDVMGRELNLTRLIVPDTKVSVTIRRDGELKDFPVEIVRVPQGVQDRRVAFSIGGLPLPPNMPEGTAFIRVDPRVDPNDEPVRARVATGTARAGGNGGSGGRITASRGPIGSGTYQFSSHSVFGADASTVGADLARVLKIEKGVLVSDVPEASRAFKSGLRTGDVIISASGQGVATLDQLQNIIVSQLGERTVVLQVIRDRKPTKVTVSW